jgi:hypothetical protein
MWSKDQEWREENSQQGSANGYGEQVQMKSVKKTGWVRVIAFLELYGSERTN